MKYCNVIIEINILKPVGVVQLQRIKIYGNI